MGSEVCLNLRSYSYSRLFEIQTSTRPAIQDYSRFRLSLFKASYSRLFETQFKTFAGGEVCFHKRQFNLFGTLETASDFLHERTIFITGEANLVAKANGPWTLFTSGFSHFTLLSFSFFTDRSLTRSYLGGSHVNHYSLNQSYFTISTNHSCLDY